MWITINAENWIGDSGYVGNDIIMRRIKRRRFPLRDQDVHGEHIGDNEIELVLNGLRFGC